MNIRKLLLIAGVISVFPMPVASQAATGKDAMEACSRAFVEYMEESRGTRIKLEIGNLDSASDRRLRTLLIYHLDARSSDSEQVVARADCTVNRHARVKNLRSLPLTAKNADERG